MEFGKRHDTKTHGPHQLVTGLLRSCGLAAGKLVKGRSCLTVVGMIVLLMFVVTLSTASRRGTAVLRCPPSAARSTTTQPDSTPQCYCCCCYCYWQWQRRQLLPGIAGRRQVWRPVRKHWCCRLDETSHTGTWTEVDARVGSTATTPASKTVLSWCGNYHPSNDQVSSTSSYRNWQTCGHCETQTDR